jgi:porphobilinogen synthase
MIHRPRRLRTTETLRAFVRETTVSLQHLVLPLFVNANLREKKPINAMPGHYQLSLNDVVTEAREVAALGISAVLLFGIPDHKDDIGSRASAKNGVVQQAIARIKDAVPSLLVIADVCFCEYTSHGHCGVLHSAHGRIDVDNDATLTHLQAQALSHARNGADIIAPSGMMDGMVAAIRTALDDNGFSHLPIMSYAVKYASSFYGPFREAAEGAPRMGDRRSYQMDPANSDEALREAALDVAQGADMLMVKPAHTYLDIISRVKTAFPALPLAAYHTSGEFAMIKAAAEKGWLDEAAAVDEVLTSIKRAGADSIITYFAKEWAQG